MALGARPAAALSTATGPLGLGAASMGSAGAAAATAEGSQGLYWNPAGLAVQGWDLGWSGADGGESGFLDQGLAVAGSLDQGLAVGLLLQDRRLGAALDDRESDAGLGAAIQLAPGLRVGTLQKIWTADPAGMTGWSMDLGLDGDLPLGSAGRVRLALVGVDLASDLAWSTGALEAEPSLFRWALAYDFWPDTWLSYQQDYLDKSGLGAQEQWRLGLQAGLPAFLFFRLGATGGGGLTTMGSVGLGWSPWFDRGRLSVDYATLWPLQAGASPGARQLLDLTWRFGPHPHGVAILTAGTLLRDAEGRLYLVRLYLRPAEPDSRSWVLVLSAEGQELKRIEGTGPLPDSVDWDGRNERGRSAKVSALDWQLTVQEPGGPVDSAGHLALTQQAPPGPSASLARPRVELKRPDTLLVSEADFAVAEVSGTAGANAWELRIVDTDGRAVRSIRGSGPVPKSVHWEGTDDLGAPAEVSLGATYELRVVDGSGTTRVALEAPMVDPASFAALASDARLEAGAWPSVMTLPRPHVIQCNFGFSRGSAELEAQAQKVLVAAVKQARAWGLDHCSAEGHADSEGSDELNQRLSSERAEAVLKALAKAGLHVPAAQLKSFGDKVPAADNGTASGRAQNRRVELKLWGRPSGAGLGPLEGQDP